MIVVVGSRHDSVARSMVRALPRAALCAAEDLTCPGWVWSLASPEHSRWVVDRTVIDDREVTGVFVRRSCVYPEELVSTHPDDREFLAAESTAFLVFVLSRTAARVVNPVIDGLLGDDAIRPEQWIPKAAELGLTLAPLRFKRGGTLCPLARTTTAVVVGVDVFGDAPPQLRAAATELAAALGVVYAAFVFDGERRLVAVSASRPPSAPALAALGSILSTRNGT